MFAEALLCSEVRLSIVGYGLQKPLWDKGEQFQGVCGKLC